MDFKNLEAWKKAKELAVTIYQLTKAFPNDEKFGLISQMRRCSVSIPSNIAEGMGRQHHKERIQFLYISRGSLYELETQLIISQELGFSTEEQLDHTLNRIRHCERVLHGLINYYKK